MKEIKIQSENLTIVDINGQLLTKVRGDAVKLLVIWEILTNSLIKSNENAKDIMKDFIDDPYGYRGRNDLIARTYRMYREAKSPSDMERMIMDMLGDDY